MEERKLRILLSKNGNGSINPRFPIPLEWFKKMGLSEENREVISTFDEKTGKLIIEKIKYN